ncbi:unnamed protein product [Camellia sinensis]
MVPLQRVAYATLRWLDQKKHWDTPSIKSHTGILFNYSMGGNPHAKAMVLFDKLRHYKWDAKAVLVLSAFATNYGEFWLIIQLYPCNPLAASIALLKQLPKDLCLLKHLFKVLNVLMKMIVDLTKCIIEFEELPVNHVILDCEAIGTTNSQIYMATYWIIRSALICSSQIKDLRAMENEFKFKTKMHNKLLDLSKESHIDNQEVLEMLFALKDSLPLKDSSSQAKLALSELKSKVVILLVSRPELLPIEVLLLLVKQMFDHPHWVNLQESYEIGWCGAYSKMSKVAVDVPMKGGFSFDLCRRNEMLIKKGLQSPSFLKTGTTIVGLIFQV